MSVEALEVLDRARRWQAAVVVLLTPTLLGFLGVGGVAVTNTGMFDDAEELVALLGGALVSVGGLGLLAVGVLLSSLMAPLTQRLRLLVRAWWIGAVAVAAGTIFSLLFLVAAFLRGF